jgi:hypothetical protein
MTAVADLRKKDVVLERRFLRTQLAQAVAACVSQSCVHGDARRYFDFDPAQDRQHTLDLLAQSAGAFGGPGLPCTMDDLAARERTFRAHTAAGCVTSDIA